MKLFYKVSPEKYRACMETIRERFGMHEEVDEASTILMLEDNSQVQKVIGTFDPNFDDFAQVKVNLKDKSLKEIFDSILGEPYRVR
jgi:hypothetical protein